MKCGDCGVESRMTELSINTYEVTGGHKSLCDECALGDCILNYKFDDDDITEVCMFIGQRVALYCDGNLQLCEADVIALACHYGITEKKILDYKFRDIKGDL